jgi:peroxiredoxin
MVAWVAGGMAVVVVALIVLLATRSPSQATSFQSPLLGKPAPLTSALTLTGGSVDLAAERGHVVVLDFFASWCPSCQAEQQQLNAFDYDQSQLAHGAAIIGLIFNDSNAAAKAFVDGQRVPYPIATDSGGRIGSAWGVANPPTTFIIDAKGIVVEALVGPLSADELDKAVAKYQRGGASG